MRRFFDRPSAHAWQSPRGRLRRFGAADYAAVLRAMSRRAYDHRIKEQIIRTGNPDLLPELEIPRSTAVSWIRRGPREVVSLDSGPPRPRRPAVVANLVAAPSSGRRSLSLSVPSHIQSEPDSKFAAGNPNIDVGMSIRSFSRPTRGFPTSTTSVGVLTALVDASTTLVGASAAPVDASISLVRVSTAPVDASTALMAASTCSVDARPWRVGTPTDLIDGAFPPNRATVRLVDVRTNGAAASTRLVGPALPPRDTPEHVLDATTKLDDVPVHLVRAPLKLDDVPVHLVRASLPLEGAASETVDSLLGVGRPGTGARRRRARGCNQWWLR
jgi:hypothetical protein